MRIEIEAGKRLAQSKRISKIVFTGETTTRRLIMHYASDNIIPVMELRKPLWQPYLVDTQKACESFAVAVSDARGALKALRPEEGPASNAASGHGQGLHQPCRLALVRAAPPR